MASTAHADGPPQRIIVKYKDGAGTSASIAAVDAVQTISQRRGTIMRTLHSTAHGAHVVQVTNRQEPAALRALIADFAARADVEYAEEDRMLKPLLTPNDTRYNEQWHYYEATGGLNLPTAWNTSTGSGVVVAVIDTGYRPHVDLVANIVGGYSMISDAFVSNDGNTRNSNAQDPGDWSTAGQCGTGEPASNSSWHGTHVAGTIAAVSNNNGGVAGVAFNAKVLPVRVLGRCGGYTSDIADGIIWASGGTVAGVPANTNPAKVISLSLGGSGACDTTTQNAINSARSRGATVIVAAGNENQDAANSNPANCAGVIAVAAIDRGGARAFYSNFGTTVTVAAPGGETSPTASNGILSTLNTGTTSPASDSYAFYQGTSMATPHVSGVAALLYSVKPTITPDEVANTLKSTARAFPASCSGCGAGIVDATAAVAAASGTGGGGTTVVLQNGVAVTNLSGAANGELKFTLAVPAGATNLKFVMSGGTGDADLYVKFGSAPTTTSYDCRPFQSGNNETCNITTAQAGTYHVLVRGYSAFSGISLTGSYTAGTGGGGSCAAGYTTYTGSLAAGASAIQPGGTYYQSTTSGTHSGVLTGPASADFDLSIQKWNGSSWAQVASSAGATSSETINYSGTAGYFRWNVLSYSGSGSYTFCLKKPS
jgi:serine protease